jgi:tripartite-type tricarboxylate transporter receptor subunit TctC
MKPRTIRKTSLAHARSVLAALFLAVPAWAPPASAQDVAAIRARLDSVKPKDFPTRPIQLIVAYAAGGGMDIHARMLAKYLQKYSGENFVVLNKVGADGFIAHSYMAAEAKPDGYTVGVLSSIFWQQSFLRAEGKWSYRDVDPIAFVNYDPLTWIVATDGPLKDKKLQDIVALAKANPGSIRVAGAFSTSTGFLVEQVEAATGAKFNQIPFPGGRPAQIALAGGHIDISFGYLGEYRGMLEGGKVKPLAITGFTRSSLLPDVPTFNETLGVNDIVWDAFRTVVLPKGMATDRKEWLEAVCNAALDDPEIAKEAASLGALVDRSLNTGSKVAEAMERRIARERPFFAKASRVQ